MISDQEIIALLPDVKNIARGIWKKIYKKWDLEDLIAEGNLALVIAARSFSLKNGTPWTAWARSRIRWEILRAIGRRLGWGGNHPKRHLSLVEHWHTSTPAIDDQDSFEARISNLKPIAKAIIRLRYEFDMSLEQIAKELHLSVGYVSQVKRAAMHQLGLVGKQRGFVPGARLCRRRMINGET